MNSEIRQLESAAMRDGAIELEWSDNSHNRFHPIWLRDNCRCSECGDPADRLPQPAAAPRST